MRRRCIKIILIFLLLGFNNTYCQTNRYLDSLLNLLKTEKDNKEKVDILVLISGEQLNFKNKDAVNSAKKALHIAQTENIPNLIANSYLALGNAHYFGNNPDSCFITLQKALKIFREENNEKKIARLFNTLGNYYKDKNLTDSAFYYFNTAKTIADKIKDDEIKTVSLLNLGALNANQLKKYTIAEEYTINALDIANQLNSKKLEAQAYFNLGIIRKNINDEIVAESYFLKSLDYFIENNYIQKQINVYNSLGSIFYEVKNYKKSKRYFNKLLSLSIKTNNLKGKAAAYHNIGSIFRKNNSIDSAIICYQNAALINKESNNLFWLSNNYAELALCLSKKKDFKMAYQYIFQSLHIDMLREDSSDIMQCYNIIAQIHFDNNLLDSAVIYFNKSNAIAIKINDVETLSENYLFLSQVYDRKFDNNKAFYFLKKYNILNDSLISIENTKMVEELEIKYNVEKKDLEIENNKSLIANLETKNKIRQIRIALLIGLLITIVIISLMIYRYISIRNKRRTEKLFFDKQMLEKDIRFSELELTKAVDEINNQAYLILEKNILISKIKEELQSIKDYKSTSNDVKIEKMSELLSAKLVTEDSWQEFKKRFDHVYPDFNAKINLSFGKLSPTETRLACLTKLKISNKDIAAMLGISTDSVLKSRYRLKKKLNLNEEEQLDEVIINL